MLLWSSTLSFNISDHAAMETRCVIAEIRPDGFIYFTTSSQAPFAIKKLMNWYFGIEPGKVIVKTPLVGGAFGGKAAVQLEIIAYLASKSVGGKLVKLLNTREEDMITSPVHIGLDASLKSVQQKTGYIKAAELQYLFDGGAYSDKSVNISRAGAVDCTALTALKIFGATHTACIQIIPMQVLIGVLVMLKSYLLLSERWTCSLKKYKWIH